MLVEHVLGDTLHAENLHLKTLSARKRVLDLCEVLLVDLVHVHGETCRCQRGFRGDSDDCKRTSCCVETTTTAVAFEVLCLLVRDEKLEIFEITLACDKC